MPTYLPWSLAAVWAVSKLAAFVVAGQILTAVNEKLPLDQQITYPIGFGKRTQIEKMYERFYPAGHLRRRLYRLSIVSVVSGVFAVAGILLRVA